MNKLYWQKIFDSLNKEFNNNNKIVNSCAIVKNDLEKINPSDTLLSNLMDYLFQKEE